MLNRVAKPIQKRIGGRVVNPVSKLADPERGFAVANALASLGDGLSFNLTGQLADFDKYYANVDPRGSDRADRRTRRLRRWNRASQLEWTR